MRFCLFPAKPGFEYAHVDICEGTAIEEIENACMASGYGLDPDFMASLYRAYYAHMLLLVGEYEDQDELCDYLNKHAIFVLPQPDGNQPAFYEMGEGSHRDAIAEALLGSSLEDGLKKSEAVLACISELYEESPY